MSTFLDELARSWVEFWGRGQQAPTINFPADEIVSLGEVLQVSGFLNAAFLNLYPTLYAVAISPDGKFIRLNGGYNMLEGGRYILHYVDGQDRMSAIQKTSEITLDGSQVSLSIVITYRVLDPVKALQVQQAVNTLLVFVQSDLKEFIRSHRHDEIVGGIDGHMPDNALIGRYIKHQHAGRDIAKLFAITHVVVREKVGDPKLTEIREKFQIERRQYAADSEINNQEQEFKRIIAAQEAEIKRIRTQSEVDLQEMSQKMELQRIQLDRAKKEQQVRQVAVDRAINAISEAFASSTYPRDAGELGAVIKELLHEVIGMSDSGSDTAAGRKEASVPAETGSPNTERIDALTETILSWLNRKRS